MGAETSKQDVDFAGWQCCAQRESRLNVQTAYVSDFNLKDAGNMSNSLPTFRDSQGLYGVGLVFRNTRDGKLVVDSFIKDSSAYQSGIVRDGGEMFILLLMKFLD